MKIALGIVIGAAIGFILGCMGQCVTGACPLTSHPILMVVAGAVFGGLLMKEK